MFLLAKTGCKTGFIHKRKLPLTKITQALPKKKNQTQKPKNTQKPLNKRLQLIPQKPKHRLCTRPLKALKKYERTENLGL